MSKILGSAAEAAAVLAWSTATASSTPLAGSAVDLSKFGKALVVFRLGDMASETIDCVVQRCDSNGSNAATLKAATQLAANASNNDNKIIVVAVDANDLSGSDQEHIRGQITTGGVTGGTCTIAVLGLEPRYGPAGDNDMSAVVEIVE
jgi:hypothetical protein